MGTKWQIEWEHIITGVKGSGEPHDNLKEVAHTAKMMDEKYPYIRHTVVPVVGDDEEDDNE